MTDQQAGQDVGEEQGEWLTVPEAVIASGTSASTIRRRLRAGAFPHAKREAGSSRWRIPLADLQADPALVMRTHTVAVRVGPEELAAWTAAREAAGRGRMGAWVRSVVNDAIAGGTYRRAPQVPEVNAEAYAHLTAAANNLNQLTRYSHQDEALHPEITEAVRLMVAAAWEVRGLSGLAGGPSAQPDPQVWANAAAAPAFGPRASEALRSGSALPLDDPEQVEEDQDGEAGGHQAAPAEQVPTTATERARAFMESLRGRSS